MIRNFNKYLLEMSISDERAKKYDTVLRELSDIKKTKEYINDLILELTDEFSNLNEIKFKEEVYGDKIYLTPKYNLRIKHIVEQLEDILDKSDNLYFKNIYPDGEEKDFYPEIEIEKSNLNRIHIPVGLPYILKGIGLGKKIYVSLIEKYGFLSSTYLDRSMDAVYVWNSIRKEKDIYTFIFDKRILCVADNIDFEKIEDILSEFFRDLNIEHIILDDDFKDEYVKKIINSKKINHIYDYEIKQN